jgi:glucokinase
MKRTFTYPVLIGDIGGTNARFAQIDSPGEAMRRFPDVRTTGHATFSEAMRDAAADQGPPPRSAVVALAAPTTGDTIPLTNAPWVVEPRKTIARLGLDEMVVINDFEAQSLSLPILKDSDLINVGGAEPSLTTKVVVGPGTGLGASALLRAGGRWVPVPGEGGHVDLGPVSERDYAIWPHLDDSRGRISAESVLSGAGLVRLYRAICAADGAQPVHSTPAALTGAGLAHDDPSAVETLNLFTTYLGRVAGDLAIIFMAHGGVYLAGGITEKLASVIAAGPFRQAFTAKAPHDDLMAEIATMVITTTDGALAGIEAMVREPDGYIIDLNGRRWTA